MADLKKYQQKRDFSVTREPEGKTNNAKLKAKKLTFVVQRHHASRLHYDFRLELDGVLKSWAVPKGPSLNPKDKRLAVQVEDHPVSYATFEGSIPKGNYGAGTVSIFDEGTYDFVESKNSKTFSEDLEKGSIKFHLHGKRLKGEFALVRMLTGEGNNWLLIKHKDEFSTDKAFDAEKLIDKAIVEEGKAFKKESAAARKTTTKSATAKSKDIANKPKPMLAKLAADLPDGDEWLYEKKFDGFRSIAVCSGNKAKLLSRNSNSLDAKFPSLVMELNKIKRDCVLDGEIVIEDKSKQAHFQLLQSGEPIPRNLELHYYVFDILELDDVDLRSYDLLQRKEILELLLKKANLPNILFVDNLNMDREKSIQEAEAKHWEGLIAKRNDSSYLEDKRSSSWLKYKLRNTQEAVICGFTEPQGSRLGFGALVLGAYDRGKLKYIGNCGTGFNDSLLKDLHKEFSKLSTKTKPFEKTVKVANERLVTWLDPTLVCDVYYSEWTKDKHLRHPVFKGLRTDKAAEETKLEIVEAKAMEKERIVKFGKKEVKLTNQDKLYWPDEGIRKGDMIAYYEEMGDYILPYVKDRPISMNRFPNGIKGKSFFQKDVEPDQLPSWLKIAPMFSKSNNSTIDYLLCNDLASLLFIANLGSIEINPWLSTYKKPDKPKFAVLDLDPNGADFDELKAVARTSKEVFDKAGVPAFIKTSGSTGFHIFLHVNERYDYEVVRDFIQFVAQLVQDQHPDTTSLVRDPKKREGMIYLDFLQNRQGQTIAAPYSLRPKPMATVSTPITWEELDEDIQIADFTIDTVPERVKAIADPWAELMNSKVDIKKALSNF